MSHSSRAAPEHRNAVTRGSLSPLELLDLARSGDRGALARLLSIVERGDHRAREIGRLTYRAGQTLDQVIGITGAPGAGKSTLTDRLIAAARRTGLRVGVLAIDPSSPFSGGALLGDRVRMQGHAGDEGVFIRSMATRGHLGGLSLAAPQAIRTLGAAGMPLVFVETVGVGQVELDIAAAADTTVVVVNPGWGDAVQASKAGLLEVADVFVVNKADRPGAEEVRRDLEMMLDMGPKMGSWRPPVLLTTASSGDGIGNLWDNVRRHRAHLAESGELAARREERRRGELSEILLRRLEQRVRELAAGALFQEVAAAVAALEVDPYDAVDRLLEPDAVHLEGGADGCD